MLSSLSEAHKNQIEIKNRRIKDLEMELLKSKESEQDLLKKMDTQKLIASELMDEIRRLRQDNRLLRDQTRSSSIDKEMLGGYFCQNVSK